MPEKGGTSASRFAVDDGVFQLACERCADGILIADDDGRFVWANTAAGEILGCPVEELLTSSVGDLDFEDAPPAAELYSRFAKKRETERGELTLRRADGSARTIHYTAGPLTPGLHLSLVRDVTERKDEQDRLRRTLHVLREAERIARIGFWDWDPDSDKGVWWSEGLYRIAGRDVDEAPPSLNSLLQDVDERDHASLVAALERGRASGSCSAEYRLIRRSDGARRVLRAVGEILRDDRGRPGRLIGAVRDITEERITEEDLQRVLDLSPDLIGVCDPDGRLLQNNPAYDRALGFERGERVSRSLYEHVHPDDCDAVERALAVAADGETAPSFRGRLVNRFGAALDIDWIFVGVPERSSIYQFGRDVTALIRAEAELRRSEARYRELVENLPCAVWEIDADNRFTYVSPNHAQLIGYEPSELLGRAAHTLLPPRQERSFKDGCDDGVAHDAGAAFEVEVTKRDGSTGHFEVRTTELRDEAGEYRGLRGVSQDISERRRAERLETQLVRAQRLEPLAVLVGGVAHDFKNLLTSISGFAQLAFEEIPADSPVSGYLADALRGCERARDLIGQILSFGRARDQAPQPTSLCDVVEDTAKLLRPSTPSHIELRLDLDRRADIVLGDSTRLHQVVMNLCANAVQAIGRRSGVVDVSVSPWETTDTDGPQGLTPGRYVLLRVRDNGPGIAPQVLQHIFDPFFTTKAPANGSGLGLPVAHRIVANAGGVLEVHSEPGAGAEFSAYLPCHSGPDPHSEASGDEAVEPSGPDRILVVDDDADLLRLVSQALRRAGYQVTSTLDSSGLLPDLLADPSRYALLLVDHMMPRTGGVELLQRYREAGGHAPAILMSGYPERLTSADLGRLDVRGLPKPFTLRALAQAVREALATPSAGGDSEPI